MDTSTTIHHIQRNSAEYPKLLKETQNPPSQLYYRGVLPKNSEVLIGIVGTRKATREGLLFAKQLSRTLAEKGFGIVSGLALGIDGAAHEGTLAGNGKTFAVLGNGLNEIYPRTHEKLANEMVKANGGIISEYEPTKPALPHQFLERNRIVAGLCVATVVIEAPIHSGSLVTARLALEAGREVFVVPGGATHPNYKGSHLLLRNGARLVTSTDDILEDLGNILETNYPEFYARLMNENKTHIATDPQEEAVLKALRESKKPLSVDTLIEITTLQSHVVLERLSLLTLEGIVEEKNGTFTIKR